MKLKLSLNAIFLFLAIGSGIILAPHLSLAATLLSSNVSWNGVSSTTVNPGAPTNALSPATSSIISNSTLPTDIYIYEYIPSGQSVSCGTSFAIAYVQSGNTSGYVWDCSTFTVGSYFWAHYVYATSSNYQATINNLQTSLFCDPTCGTSLNGVNIIAASNSNGVIEQIYDNPATPPSPVSSTVNFVFPTDTTSTPDFKNWIVSAGNLNASDSYALQIYYSQVGSPTEYIDTIQFGELVSADTVVIPKTQSLNSSFVASTAWQANAQLLNTSIPFCNGCNYNSQLVASSTIQFTVLNNGQFITNNTSSSYQQATSTINIFGSGIAASVNAVCTAPTSSIFSDPATYTAQSLAYGLCTVSVFLIVPSTGLQNYLQNSVTNIEQAQPFAGVFGTLNQLEGTASSPPSSQDLTDPNFNFGSSASTTPGLVILGSTTMSVAITPAGKTILFTLEDNLFDLLVLGLIFYVPWHWWRKKHNQQITPQ